MIEIEILKALWLIGFFLPFVSVVLVAIWKIQD
jgi:hypothetical protein